MTWCLILNPNAASGRAGRDWAPVADRLAAEGVAFDLRRTGAPGHAAELARTAFEEGSRKFLVYGGDGTVNEAVNGILESMDPDQKIQAEVPLLAQIPAGTGNDWKRTLRLPDSIPEIIELIAAERSMAHDVGRMEVETAQGPGIRYFINVAGMGYDAVVAEATNELKRRGKGGTAAYLACLVKCLVTYRPVAAEIITGDTRLTCDLFSLSVGIGRFNGGGMMQLPRAVPDDGLFDVTVIRRLGRLRVLANVKRLYNGTLLEYSRVTALQGQSLSVQTATPLPVETDGEAAGTTPVRFEMLKHAVRVIAGKI